MDDLRALREGWEEIEALEATLREPMTMQESVAIYEGLHEAFAAQLNATDALFRPAREAHLIELQTRLQRLGDWMRERDDAGPDSEHHTDTNSPA